jgi:hypothetical protein
MHHLKQVVTCALSLGILVSTTPAFGQTQPQQGVWAMGTPWFEDHARSVQPTSDGGWVVGGHTQSYGAGLWDLYVVKLNAAHEMEWTRTVGGLGSEFGYSVMQTADGGYLAVGHSQSFVWDAGYDIFVVRLDAAGDLVWSNTYGGPLDDFGFTMALTPDGGCVVAGITESFGHGIWDMYALKIGADGALQWSRTIGGPDWEEARAIWPTNDGGFVLAGLTRSYGVGNADMYVVKLNGEGELQWTRTIGGAGNDEADSVQQTSDGGFIVAGSTTSYGAGGQDAYLVRLDAAGQLLWTKVMGGPGDDVARTVRQTPDQGFVMAGSTGSGVNTTAAPYMLKVSATGAFEWAHALPVGAGEGHVFQVYPSSGGDHMLGGYAYNAEENDWYILLARVDGAGTSCGTSLANIAVQSGGTIGSGGEVNTGGTAAMVLSEASYGGKITSICLAMGIEHAALEAMHIFPSPADDHFRVTGLDAGRLVVRDAVGRLMTEPRQVFGEVVISTAHWACGTYFVEVSAANSERSTVPVWVVR